MSRTEQPYVEQGASNGKAFRDKSARELICAPGIFERIWSRGTKDLGDEKPSLALLRVLM